MALFRNDEELGKKDDEYKPGSRRMWQQRRLSQLPPRRSLRRISLTILAVISVFYLFRHTLRKGEHGDQRLQSAGAGMLSSKVSSSQSTTTNPSRPVTTGQIERNFNGPIRFYNLASSLHVAGKLMGSNPYNQNVVSVQLPYNRLQSNCLAIRSCVTEVRHITPTCSLRDGFAGAK